MMRILPISVLLVGCVGPVFNLAPLDKRACAESLVDDGSELVFMVNQGNGNGAFDYQPDWALVDRIDGNYDLKTGAFWWEVHYASTAWRTLDRVDGLGSLTKLGDVDIEYTRVTTYADGQSLQEAVRQERVACAETRRVENLDSGEISIYAATLSGGGRDWFRDYVQGPAQPQAEGRLNPDRSWWENVDYKADGVSVNSATEGDGDGYALRTFDEDDGYNVLKGTWEQFADGTVAWDFTLNNPDTSKQTWTFSELGDGTGDGTWTDGTDTCDVKFVNGGNCKLRNCSDPELEGSCSPPVHGPLR